MDERGVLSSQSSSLPAIPCKLLCLRCTPTPTPSASYASCPQVRGLVLLNSAGPVEEKWSVEDWKKACANKKPPPKWLVKVRALAAASCLGSHVHMKHNTRTCTVQAMAVLGRAQQRSPLLGLYGVCNLQSIHAAPLAFSPPRRPSQGVCSGTSSALCQVP